MGSITTATDISFEKLTEYAGLLAELEENNKTEIYDRLEEINGLLVINVGSTSFKLEEFNSYISGLYRKLIDLIEQTGRTINNISVIFAKEDKEDVAVIEGKN